MMNSPFPIGSNCGQLYGLFFYRTENTLSLWRCISSLRGIEDKIVLSLLVNEDNIGNWGIMISMRRGIETKRINYCIWVSGCCAYEAGGLENNLAMMKSLRVTTP